ncbi:MAG TPA: YdeI/OmpD-associated family protein [Tahibacter sp.]|uniref:YdeI/OmpD-associated family protein n=1 Tax=Tahibacter sp. TaxID=2056211 RepID=UPI002D0E1F3F|nr:YdeI/OmpD-associated family protein [Tahibacter sp.]HSX62150.1 YdeI/OmpD-associated family protein [Tahibacter sp.]
MDARYFRSPAEFRRWLKSNHAKAAELWVGYHKVGSGEPSLTWPQSVDEALCYGWIDGVRQRVDETRYRIRFTPRRDGSIWSNVNVRRIGELEAEGRVEAAGRAAFAARREDRSAVYSYERRIDALPPERRAVLDANPAAAAFFDTQPPSYRRACCNWIVGAKQEPTRVRRLQQLIEHCERGETLAQFTRR